MKVNYFNALTIDLIENKNYLPLKDSSGSYIVSDISRYFIKSNQYACSIIQLADGDRISKDEFIPHMESNLKWAQNVKVQGFTGKPFFIEVLAFSSFLDQSKIDFITESYQTLKNQGKDFALLAIDLMNKKMFFNMGLVTPYEDIEILLVNWMIGSLSSFERLPNLDMLIERQNSGPDVLEVSKGIPGTYTLMAVNSIIWIIGLLVRMFSQNDYLFIYGSKDPSLITHGELWRFFTPMVLHAENVAHIVGNLLALLFIGQIVERVFGTKKFLFIYLAGGLLANLASFAAITSPSICASGAVLSIGGAMFYIWFTSRKAYEESKRDLFILILLIGYNVFFGFVTPGVDNVAHIGGILGGFLMSGILSLEYETPNTRKKVISGIVLIAVALLCIVIGFLRFH